MTAVVRRALTGVALLALVLLTAAFLPAQAENLPPKPTVYFTDQANVVDASVGEQINQQLAQFERDTSNQLLVVIYPGLPDGEDVDLYSINTFNSWGVGQKGQNNGVVLFVYIKDHKMFIVTGRGLEGALPDAICKNIVTLEITPHFKQGDYTGGIQAGVNAIIAATKGEYKGTGQTDNEQQQGDSGGGIPLPYIIAFIIVFILLSTISHRAGFYGAPMIYTGGGWGGGGGGFGGGGGGFSGGGGSSAGGGAGGGW